MARRKFRVTLAYEVEIDEQVIDRCDEKWRRSFYPLDTPEKVAAHVGYNMLLDGCGLAVMDGFRDLPDDLARIVGLVDAEAKGSSE